MAGLLLTGLSLIGPTLGNIFGGGGGSGSQGGQGGSVNQDGYGTVPDQAAPYYGPTAFPQYDQSALLQAKEEALKESDAKIAAVQAQAQAVVMQQQVKGELEKMKITSQLSQQNFQLQQAQAQLAAAQAQAASGAGLLPYLAVGAVLLVVLLK
jgi:hypothetical protein